MSIRRAFIILAAWQLALMVASACSQPTQYRLLSFFFDGVPKPGERPTVGYAPLRPPVAEAQQVPETTQPAIIRKVYSHPPYEAGHCGACHDPLEGGQILRTAEQGLCLDCHGALTATARYLHGPVAANACLQCHHHHWSYQPAMLLEPPPAICLSCHDGDEVAAGDHHAGIGGRSCVECHDPHGGGNRFFLRRTEH